VWGTDISIWDRFGGITVGEAGGKGSGGGRISGILGGGDKRGESGESFIVIRRCGKGFGGRPIGRKRSKIPWEGRKGGGRKGGWTPRLLPPRTWPGGGRVGGSMYANRKKVGVSKS